MKKDRPYGQKPVWSVFVWNLFMDGLFFSR